MKRVACAAVFVLLSVSFVFAQDPSPVGQAASPAAGRQGGRGPALPPIDPPKEWISTKAPKNLVEFEMMTWPEVYDAIHHQGKTVALYYVGGTEHRGPQNVNGGHTLMARDTVREIARQLGNAIAMPVLPYSPNNASNQQTGTIGLTPDILSTVLEQLAEQAIATGFTTVVLMGDHGGGQPAAYASVAKKLEDKYRAPELAAKNIHVYFCDEVYAKAQGDFDDLLKQRGLSVSSHAGIPDTSEMMYLGKGKNWVRTDLLKYAVTMGPGYTPAPPAPRGANVGQTAGQTQGGGRAAADPNAPRVVASGVSGDGRQSNKQLGKEAFDIKVEYAVRQIKALMVAQAK